MSSINLHSLVKFCILLANTKNFEGIDAGGLIADTGYESDATVERAENANTRVVIPPHFRLPCISGVLLFGLKSIDDTVLGRLTTLYFSTTPVAWALHFPFAAAPARRWTAVLMNEPGSAQRRIFRGSSGLYWPNALKPRCISWKQYV
jgi:hypothetical protein